MGTRQIYIKNKYEGLVLKEMEKKDMKMGEVVEAALKKYFGVK